MIEVLTELAQAGGIQRFVISLSNSSSDQVAVSVQGILGAEPESPTLEQKKVREALSTPLVVSGSVSEVDAKIDSMLEGYAKSIRPLQGLLKSNQPNVDDAVDAALAPVEKESNATGAKPAKSNEPVQDEDGGSDKFISGEADSL